MSSNNTGSTGGKSDQEDKKDNKKGGKYSGMSIDGSDPGASWSGIKGGTVVNGIRSGNGEFNNAGGPHGIGGTEDNPTNRGFCGGSTPARGNMPSGPDNSKNGRMDGQYGGQNASSQNDVDKANASVADMASSGLFDGPASTAQDDQASTGLLDGPACTAKNVGQESIEAALGRLNDKLNKANPTKAGGRKETAKGEEVAEEKAGTSLGTASMPGDVANAGPNVGAPQREMGLIEGLVARQRAKNPDAYSLMSPEIRNDLAKHQARADRMNEVIDNFGVEALVNTDDFDLERGIIGGNFGADPMKENGLLESMEASFWNGSFMTPADDPDAVNRGFALYGHSVPGELDVPHPNSPYMGIGTREYGPDLAELTDDFLTNNIDSYAGLKYGVQVSWGLTPTDIATPVDEYGNVHPSVMTGYWTGFALKEFTPFGLLLNVKGLNDYSQGKAKAHDAAYNALGLALAVPKTAYNVVTSPFKVAKAAKALDTFVAAKNVAKGTADIHTLSHVVDDLGMIKNNTVKARNDSMYTNRYFGR
ncbi:hypothetical protein [Maridesulfovibrio sp.]|uniref:hypothetical protein n=1 Tax=Maridesulfovibrio sp. TaxID=2795000 RepID=UPI003BAC9223